MQQIEVPASDYASLFFNEVLLLVPGLEFINGILQSDSLVHVFLCDSGESFDEFCELWMDCGLNVVMEISTGLELIRCPVEDNHWELDHFHGIQLHILFIVAFEVQNQYILEGVNLLQLLQLFIRKDELSALGSGFVHLFEEQRTDCPVDSLGKNHFVLGKVELDAVVHSQLQVYFYEDFTGVPHSTYDLLVSRVADGKVDMISGHFVQSRLLNELPGILESPVDYVFVLVFLYVQGRNQLFVLDVVHRVSLNRPDLQLSFLLFEFEALLVITVDNLLDVLFSDLLEILQVQNVRQ